MRNEAYKVNNIYFAEDESYMTEADWLLIEKGAAEIGVHSLKIDRYFSEERKEANRQLAARLTDQQWSAHCDESKASGATKIKRMVDKLTESLTVYQYNQKVGYQDDWDLYFFCLNGDMSYVTLSPNKRKSPQSQWDTINKALALLSRAGEEDIKVTIQYKAIYKEEKVNEMVEKAAGRILEKTIDYKGNKGKIKIVGKTESGGTRYGFFKSRARKNYLPVNRDWLLMQVR